MKYEVYFLNNIFGSIKIANVELDPFLELFSQGDFEVK